MRFFVNSTSLLLEDYPAHNEAIAGDSLFSIELNYKWRKLLTGLLQKAWENDGSERALDNHDFLSALILDLYTAEALNVDIITRLETIDIGANRTTTSGTFALVTGTNLSHTPTKANMRIKCSSITINNSGATFTIVEVRFNAVAAAENGFAQMFGSTAVPSKVVGQFSGYTLGVAHDIGLYWRVTGGTGTMFQASRLLFEIDEWD